MTKDRFEEALDYICHYDYVSELKNITPKVTKDFVEVSLSLVTSDDEIDYGEYPCKKSMTRLFHKELYPILVNDGFLDEKGKASDEVAEAKAWKVYLCLTDGDDVYASIHLFDYTEEGVKLVGESANYK
ncbi:hypothetical protein QVO10_08705 [Bacteroides gallinaceum]|jgi:hypothetical protein|uniref:Uncharacterized protein n=3 Tax=Bacteroidaceae TaxID=815 RepID=A0ABT7X5V3_9BACE|nr:MULTISPECIES: hypothetical protein [Bacteroidaceae]MBD8040538.1 hypothetical protein [Phocaeicola intestinalis]MBM6721341.1 hypothetical protein [Bacteroides gallinaceum]MBM6945915.1 hypothetical protein [Bacteroides gallinaceum]MDN0049464.1 hypothetical protein [Bacteroides gallinaceum]OUO53675.1 hypothetical protein B5F78_11655 [Bacteroides sp. An279]